VRRLSGEQGSRKRRRSRRRVAETGEQERGEAE